MVRYDMVWPRFRRSTIRDAGGFCLHAGRSCKPNDHSWGEQGRLLGMHGLLILERGAGTYSDGDGRHERTRPGDLIQLFPDLRHDYGPGPHDLWEERFIDCDGGIVTALAAQGLFDRSHPLLHPTPDALAALRRLIDDVEHGRLADPAEAQWRLHGALLTLARWRRGSEDAALERARCVLAANLATACDPRAAADAAGMGWELFRKRFRARYGLPPARWRLHARCEAAGELLVSGSTVEAVATAMGFCDGAHLRRHFRATMGMTPEGWRRLRG